MIQASHPLRTTSESDEEEDYLQDEDQEGHIVCIGPSLVPARSGYIRTADDAKVGDEL